MSERSTVKPELVPPAGHQGSAPAKPEPALPVGPVVRMSVDARGLSLAILAVIAVIVALEWAQTFVVSLLVGILIAYTLNPLVVWLERIRIPRVVATTVVMLGVMGALVLGGYLLRGQVQAIVDELPSAASKFSAGLARLRTSQGGAMQKVQSAATEVEKATTQVAAAAVVPRQPATHVVVDAPTFKMGDFLWTGSKGAAGAFGQAVTVLFLAFFLLLGGDTFKRKLVRLTGPSLSNKKITVQILDDINGSIQKYLFMMLLTNVLVGLLAWVAFAGSASTTPAPGRSRRGCCTSSPTSVPASPPPPPGWPPSCSSTRSRWRCWSPAHRWRSPPSSEPSSRRG